VSAPSLVQYETESEYKDHYIDVYCRSGIRTFDGFSVRFAARTFEHAFYKSSDRSDVKDTFSPERAERIDWIKYALESPDGDIRAGWDKRRGKYDFERRVAIVMGDYVVVISIQDREKKKAVFITAYIADADALPKILKSPEWK